MKKTIYIVVLIIFSLLITGCKKGENSIREGIFYTLSEAYNNNIIDKDDLINIAYYYNGKRNINDQTVEIKSLDWEKFNDDVILAIKYNYYLYNSDYFDNYRNITIREYYGSYNDTYCVMMESYCVAGDVLFYDLEIDGVKFEEFTDLVQIFVFNK